MSLIRWIIGGALGAVVGAAAWVALEQFAPREFPTEWGAIFVGILGGLGTRFFANADRIHFGRGAVAMVLSLLCIVGAKYAYAQIQIASQGDAAAPAPVALQTDTSEDPEDDGDSTDVTPAPVPMEEVPVVALETPSLTGDSIKSAFSVWDMVWFGLSGLIAYQLGKSPRRRPAAEQSESGSADTSPEKAT